MQRPYRHHTHADAPRCWFHLLQVFEWVLYDSWENKLVRKFPRTTWLRRSRTDAEGRTFAVPSRACMLAVRCVAVHVRG